MRAVLHTDALTVSTKSSMANVKLAVKTVPDAAILVTALSV